VQRKAEQVHDFIRPCAPGKRTLLRNLLALNRKQHSPGQTRAPGHRRVFLDHELLRNEEGVVVVGACLCLLGELFGLLCKGCVDVGKGLALGWVDVARLELQQLGHQLLAGDPLRREPVGPLGEEENVQQQAHRRPKAQRVRTSPPHALARMCVCKVGWRECPPRAEMPSTKRRVAQRVLHVLHFSCMRVLPAVVLRKGGLACAAQLAAQRRVRMGADPRTGAVLASNRSLWALVASWTSSASSAPMAPGTAPRLEETVAPAALLGPISRLCPCLRVCVCGGRVRVRVARAKSMLW